MDAVGGDYSSVPCDIDTQALYGCTDELAGALPRNLVQPKSLQGFRYSASYVGGDNFWCV